MIDQIHPPNRGSLEVTKEVVWSAQWESVLEISLVPWDPHFTAEKAM
jgi:hypothetical protein